MKPEVSDRDLTALIEWLVTETSAGRLERYETGVGSFSPIGDAGNIHLRRVARTDSEGELDAPAYSMTLTNPAGKFYRQVGQTLLAGTTSTPDELLEASRNKAFTERLATLFTAVHGARTGRSGLRPHRLRHRVPDPRSVDPSTGRPPVAFLTT